MNFLEDVANFYHSHDWHQVFVKSQQYQKSCEPLCAFRNDINQICLARLLGPPIQNDVPLYKKDIKDKAYRLKISARSWYISVNMLTIATDTDIRHNIFVEDQNDSHQNIRIPLSEILLPEDFGRSGYTWNACYNFINFKIATG